MAGLSFRKNKTKTENVLTLDLNESREGFCRTESGRTVLHAERPKTEMAREPTSESLVTALLDPLVLRLDFKREDRTGSWSTCVEVSVRVRFVWEIE